MSKARICPTATPDSKVAGPGGSITPITVYFVNFGIQLDGDFDGSETPCDGSLGAGLAGQSKPSSGNPKTNTASKKKIAKSADESTMSARVVTHVFAQVGVNLAAILSQPQRPGSTALLQNGILATTLTVPKQEAINPIASNTAAKATSSVLNAKTAGKSVSSTRVQSSI